MKHFGVFDEIRDAFSGSGFAARDAVEEGVVQDDVGAGIRPIVVKGVLDALVARCIATVDDKRNVFAR